MDPGRRADDPLSRLTDAQLEAVTADDPRLAVLAGAGAGKTTVLTLRVRQMVASGIDPHHLLVVTFSRRAAQELRDRLWRLDVEGVRSGTFHATALELLEVRRADQGLGPPRILPDRRRSLARMLESIGRTLARSAPATLDTEISWGKGHGLEPRTYEDGARRAGRRSSLAPKVVAELWGRYEEGKGRSGMLDFDDLIIDAAEALRDPAFAKAIHWRTRHVLIDEFQDVSPMQFLLVERLMTPSTTLFCVGDPNQSIYGFNGADPALLTNLASSFPDLRTIALDDNHRSTPEIVAAAAAVLPADERRAVASTQSTGRPPTIVTCDDDAAEAAMVVGAILAGRGPSTPWGTHAVLARTNAQLTALASACEAAGVPHRMLAPDLSDQEAGNLDGSPRRRGWRDDDQPEDVEADAVVLATFHRSKGLEWPTVFVIGASDGLVPHAAASTPAGIAEEQRLLYVALTRAGSQLTVSWARRRDGEERRGTPERSLSPLLKGMVAELARQEEASRPAPVERAGRHLAAMRRQVAEARRQREDSDGEGA
jgi:superfamily I DNA/RNA helicase